MALTATQVAEVLTVFRQRAQEFASVADADVEAWIEIEGPNVSQAAFDDCWATAVAYRTAHMMKTTGEGADSLGTGGAGPVTSRKAGPRSISFGSVSSSNDESDAAFWKESRYGRLYLSLRYAARANTPVWIGV